MLSGAVKRVFTSGPAGPAGATLASALQDVAAGMKAVLTAPDLPTARASFGLAIGQAVQAWSATLDALAGLSTTAFGRSLLTQADAPTALGTLGAVPASAAALSLKANLTASTALVTDATLTQFLDASLGAPTRGALLYRGASAYLALPPGAAGQYLGTGGAGADPSWNTPSGGGNVLTVGAPAAGQFALFSSSTAIKGAGAASFRNRLRNGNLAINQRALSGTVTLAAGAYGHDGFKAGANGATYTFATAANGDTTLTLTAGTLIQIVRGAELEGGVYTLSWSGSATARVYQGTASGSYAAGPITTGSLTGGTNASVEFSTGALGLVQFEPGTVTTPFERRDDELRRCQRYLLLLTDQMNTGGVASGATGVFMRFAYPNDMVAPPTLTITAGTWNLSDDYASDPQASSPSLGSYSRGTRGGRVYLGGFSGLTTGRFYGATTAAIGTAVILVSAEI